MRTGRVLNCSGWPQGRGTVVVLEVAGRGAANAAANCGSGAGPRCDGGTGSGTLPKNMVVMVRER